MRTNWRGATWIGAVALLISTVWTGAAHGAVAIGPENDRFGRAADLVLDAAIEGTTLGATTEPGEPARSCSAEGVGTVWYRYRPQSDGVLVLTLDSVRDLGVAAYTGNNVRNLAEIACADWAYGGEQERAQFRVQGGIDYSIAVAGYTLEENDRFTLAARQVPPAPHDDFADAGALSEDSAAEGTTVGATPEAGDPDQQCTWEPTFPVWYRYEATASRRMRFTLDSPTDQGFAIYTGTSSADLELVGCVDNIYEGGSEEVETLDVSVTEGATYWIAVRPYTFVESATFTLMVSPTPIMGDSELCVKSGRISVCATTPVVGLPDDGMLEPA